MRSMFVNLFVIAVFSAAGMSFGTSSVSAQVPSSQLKPTTIEKLLKESGVNFQPFEGDGTFISIYEGKLNKEISVILIEADAAVVILSDVAAGKEVGLTPTVLRELLEYNLKTDYIKVGISDLKSIRVQTEQELTGLTAASLKLMVDQVAAGNDEVAKIIQPVRKKSPTPK